MVPLVAQTLLLVQVLPRGVLPQALVQAAMGRVYWMSGSASPKGEPLQFSWTAPADRRHHRHCICCHPLCQCRNRACISQDNSMHYTQTFKLKAALPQIKNMTLVP
jgi:hypothetical protein